MKVEAQSRDAESLVVDYLEVALDDTDCTVSVGVPADWKPTSTPHVEVASDGEPFAAWPIATYVTIRLVARAASTSDAKALCARAQGRVLAHNGDEAIVNVRYLTGVLPARDPDTHFELASATVSVSLRTEPIESGS